LKKKKSFTISNKYKSFEVSIKKSILKKKTYIMVSSKESAAQLFSIDNKKCFLSIKSAY